MHDSHVHSDISADGRDSVEKLQGEASRRGILSVAITDHCELMMGHSERELSNLIQRSQDIVCKVSRKTRGGALLRFGIELGQPHVEPELAEKLLNEFDFDIVLGSVHKARGYGELFNLIKENDSDVVRKALKCYLDELLQLVLWNKFDVLAHMWYPVRYIESSEIFEGFGTKISEILKLLAKNGKALELNMSTRGKDLTKLILHCLREYVSYGGEFVTLASDSHCVENLGRGFKEAGIMLAECGFRNYVYYEKRKPVKVRIG